MSYNSRGFSDHKINYCRYLMSFSAVGHNVPLLCIQEHFLLKGNLFKIDQAFPGCHVIPKPALKETLDRGRARNGMAIIMPATFKNHVSDISPNHWRIQAVIVTSNKSKMLLINSYFPTDDQLALGNEIGELIEVLEAIGNLISSTNFDSLLLLGDINADLLRNSNHCLQIKRFAHDLGLLFAWENMN